jgi:hypothetical protein
MQKQNLANTCIPELTCAYTCIAHPDCSIMAQEKEDKAFNLSVNKFAAIVGHIAGQKRGKMHKIMPKNKKVVQQDADLTALNNSQAFVGEAPLKPASLDRYEGDVLDLAEQAGNAKDDSEMSEIMLAANMPFTGVSLTNFLANGGDWPATQEGILSNLLVIYTEVHRAPSGPADMTHAELQDHKEAEKNAKKNEKAEKGHKVLQKSTNKSTAISRQVHSALHARL